MAVIHMRSGNSTRACVRLHCYQHLSCSEALLQEDVDVSTALDQPSCFYLLVVTLFAFWSSSFMQHGQAPLSDLQCTTSSEALLCGKAPTFRLLVWAIDRSGAHLPHITYVVSESFVVATKRVKHAIKSDIPSIGNHISKLVHIGKATVDKLQDIKQAAAEESMDIDLPDRLNRVDKVNMQHQEVVMRLVNFVLAAATAARQLIVCCIAS